MSNDKIKKIKFNIIKKIKKKYDKINKLHTLLIFDKRNTLFKVKRETKEGKEKIFLKFHNMSSN